MIATRDDIRIMVRGTYDLQKLRCQMGNRLVGNFKVKIGVEPGTKEEDLSDREKASLLKQLHAEYNRITDGIVKLGVPGDGIISTEAEFVLVGQYVSLLKQEEDQFKNLSKQIQGILIWDKYLKAVKGVGPQMAGVLISEIDITRAKYASSLWKYAGLDVVMVPHNGSMVGEGRSRRADHLVTVKYKNKDGEDTERKSITFNPFLKTKLIGVLGGSFLKTKGEYSDIYYDYRTRLENHAVYGIANDEQRIAEFKANGKKYSPKAHRHNMAVRYMIKCFLADLYEAWRPLEGLPVHNPYAEAKLEMAPHAK